MKTNSSYAKGCICLVNLSKIIKSEPQTDRTNQNIQFTSPVTTNQLHTSSCWISNSVHIFGVHAVELLMIINYVFLQFMMIRRDDSSQIFPTKLISHQVGLNKNRFGMSAKGQRWTQGQRQRWSTAFKNIHLHTIRVLDSMTSSQEIQDLSTCSVCLLQYNDDERQPKYLNCHHTFCLQCLEVSF